MPTAEGQRGAEELRYAVEQLGEGVRELLHSLLLQHAGDVVDRDPGRLDVLAEIESLGSDSGRTRKVLKIDDCGEM